MVTTFRFAAELLFQFRVVIDGKSNRRRTVERRIIHLHANTPRQALRKAKRYGKTEQYDYRNSDGNPVLFEFIGVTDLIQIGAECDEMTVWYDIQQVLTPMERQKALLPDERTFSAIKHDSKPSTKRLRNIPLKEQ